MKRSNALIQDSHLLVDERKHKGAAFKQLGPMKPPMMNMIRKMASTLMAAIKGMAASYSCNGADSILVGASGGNVPGNVSDNVSDCILAISKGGASMELSLLLRNILNGLNLGIFSPRYRANGEGIRRM